MLNVCVCVFIHMCTDDIKIITYRRLERNVCGNWEVYGHCKCVSDSYFSLCIHSSCLLYNLSGLDG